jgi:site-specific DNA-methyltransferase (adenine-specific)
VVTKKQKQVLDFVISHQQANGYAPSLQEIQRRFKFASVSTSHYHITRLKNLGYLNTKTRKSRSIEILEAPQPVASLTKDHSRKPIEEFVDRIFEADCLDLLPQIPDKSIDMILCDLPYGTTQNHWDSVIPLDRLWAEYERIIRDHGIILLTGQGLFSANLMLSNQKLFKYKITWVKSKPTNFLNAKRQPLRKHEDILVFYKNQPTYSPQMSPGLPYTKGFRKNQLTGSYGDFGTVEVKSDTGDRYPTDVIYFKTAESEGPVYHPTQKPVELGRYLIRTYTKPGDIVLDNAAGSGSFLVSAILEKRKFIGIEKNKEVYLHRKHKTDYIRVCENRIKYARAKANVKPNTLF